MMPEISLMGVLIVAAIAFPQVLRSPRHPTRPCLRRRLKCWLRPLFDKSTLRQLVHQQPLPFWHLPQPHQYLIAGQRKPEPLLQPPLQCPAYQGAGLKDV